MKAYSYVRFSTSIQIRGDSLRRQMELSQQWCEKNGVVLDDTLDMQDLGKSAFHGDNVTQGALGQFIKTIDKGKVKKGSYLLVESLDRLSRQELTDALSLFLNIINKGITIVTLADDRTYGKKNLDLPNLIISLSIMSRAHEESAMKSQRISQAWSQKRKNVGERILTKNIPNWLEIKNGKIVAIPERKKLIRRMFDMKVGGQGALSISRTLNKEGVPTWGRASKWNSSYIRKTLPNRAVLGEFQPGKRIDNKRVPVGPPIIDYYPRIIPDELFYRVQKLLENRSLAGRKPKNEYANLFRGLIRCPACFSAMIRICKDSGGRLAYLLCSGAYTKSSDCKWESIRYQRFEELFFKFVADQINLKDLQNGDATKLAKIDKKIAASQDMISSLTDRIRNWTDAIGETKDKELREDFISRVESARNQIRETEKEIQSLQQQRSNIDDGPARQRQALRTIKQLFKTGAIDDPDTRRQLREQLLALIDGILIHPKMEWFQIFFKSGLVRNHLGKADVELHKQMVKEAPHLKLIKDWRGYYIETNRRQSASARKGGRR